MPTGGTKFLAVLGAVSAILFAVPASASAGSADIAAVQVAMGALGLYPHPVDGISGPWTQGAVRTFQSQHNLAADGIAGPQTRAALGRRGKPNLGARPMREGKRGWDVAALQFLLHTRGFEPGGFDGGFGRSGRITSACFACSTLGGESQHSSCGSALGAERADL